MHKLIVKNFGPLKVINIELNKTNLFIGENGSGKSILAKLITIVTDKTLIEDEILTRFKDYEIDFIVNDTFIQLEENGRNIISIDQGSVKQDQAIIKAKENHEFIVKMKEISELSKKIDDVNIQNINSLILKPDTQKKIDAYKKSKIEDSQIQELLNTYKSFKSKYIPAERNLVSLFNQSLSNLITSNIPLPKTLLEFSSQYNSAKNEIKELNILDMKYENNNGQDRIYYDEECFLPLANSSSGIQTSLPLYLTLKYFNKKHSDIIIEEPEQNLYPKAQSDTIKFIIENSSENLYLMTHSPYVLSTLNILLFAYKASNKNDILKEKISEIIPESQQINPDEFSAYFIKNGVSKSIKGESTGMIVDNAIDESSDIIDDKFNELMDIYREYKNNE